MRALEFIPESIGDKRTDSAGSDEYVINKYLVKFTPTEMLIYKGGELVYKKLGNYSNPTRGDVSIASGITTKLWEKDKLGLIPNLGYSDAVEKLVNLKRELDELIRKAPYGSYELRKYKKQYAAASNQLKDLKATQSEWKNKSEVSHSVQEEVIDEMPLPTNWDPAQMQQQGTSFKSRLAYALERAKKIGAGSSRVAMTIDYQGRPTVLKVAKNAKGLAQNSVEADILSDGYGSQIGIMIPIIDYDEQHREPLWLHTELAQKANEQQLCRLMKCDSLMQLVRFGNTIAGKYRGQTAQQFMDDMINDGKSEQDVEICTDYANKLADLANSFDVELADFARPANWGIYNGNPVVIDVGFNSNVMNQYYK